MVQTLSGTVNGANSLRGYNGANSLRGHSYLPMQNVKTSLQPSKCPLYLGSRLPLCYIILLLGYRIWAEIRGDQIRLAGIPTVT